MKPYRKTEVELEEQRPLLSREQQGEKNKPSPTRKRYATILVIISFLILFLSCIHLYTQAVEQTVIYQQNKQEQPPPRIDTLLIGLEYNESLSDSPLLLWRLSDSFKAVVILLFGGVLLLCLSILTLFIWSLFKNQEDPPESIYRTSKLFSALSHFMIIGSNASFIIFIFALDMEWMNFYYLDTLNCLEFFYFIFLNSVLFILYFLIE